MILKEWKLCRCNIKVKFIDLRTKNAIAWRHIMMHCQEQFSNICLVLSMVISISVSNLTVERCFSILMMMMTGRRLQLSHETMRDVIRIKCNNKLWSDQEPNRIIDRAVELLLSKRRTTQIDNPTKRPLPVIQIKRQ